jgi:acyl-CoA synthetase (AMP-forming)/AMP-acid ligase II
MPTDLTQFGTLTEALAAAPGDRVFATLWIDEDEHDEVTFEQFRHRACGQARILHKHGIACGDRVVIIMPQSIEAMATFVGAMMLGAAPAFLAYPNFKIEPAKYRSGLAGVTTNLAAKVVVIDDEFPDDLLLHVLPADGSQLLRTGKPATETSLDGLPPHKSRSDELAFIQHSAGTTGLQKGVALTHRAVLRQIQHLAEILKLDSKSDRIYSWLPLYHDMGLIACFILPMVCHVPVVVQSPLDWVMHPETMPQVITDYKCTLAWMPNFAFQFIARRTRPECASGYDLSSLRDLINCSEPVRASSMLEFQRAFCTSGLRSGVLQSSYAMAENVFAVTQSPVEAGVPFCIYADGARFRSEHSISVVDEGEAGAVSFVSSGHLLPNHKLRITSDDGLQLEQGRVGEILINSDCLFDGYYNRPDLTAEAFIDGWYRTGDLGFRIDDELFVVGRKKDLLIVGGENLYPQDIEEIVSSHPRVHDGRAVALGIYNPELGTEDIVVVVEVEDQALATKAAETEAEIRSLVVASLGMAVRAVYLKPPLWLIKSTAGKPARSATREKLLLEHPELQREYEEVRLS